MGLHTQGEPEKPRRPRVGASFLTGEPLRGELDQLTLVAPKIGRWFAHDITNTVPTYQYRCAKCEKAFERTETISEHEVAKPQCPKCGSKKVSAVPGRVYVVTQERR